MKFFDLDNWQEIWIALKKNPVRTFFTAFGVYWGIFMLVVMLGSGNGLKNAVYNGFSDFATNSFFMWTETTSMPYQGFKRGRNFNFVNSDIKAIRQDVPEVKLLAPRLRGGGYRGSNNVVYGKETGAFNIFGDYPDYFKIDPMDMLTGRVLNDNDIHDYRKVAMIGQAVIQSLFKNGEDPLGKYIRIQGVYFQVIGTFKSKKTGPQAESENNNIFLPFTSMQRAFNYGNKVFWFAINSQDNVPASITETKVVALMKKLHHINPKDDQAIGHFNLEKEFRKMQGLFNGINGLVWIVGIGTLLAGMIGVSNIMLIIVKERTKEIGVKRALGARPMHIITQIILESVTLTTVAGYVGLVIGVGLLALIDNLLIKSGASTDFFLHPSISFDVGVSALGILIFAGALAGLIPAKRAASIKPIEALRDE